MHRRDVNCGISAEPVPSSGANRSSTHYGNMERKHPAPENKKWKFQEAENESEYVIYFMR